MPIRYGVPLESKSGGVSAARASRAEAMSTAAKPIKPDVNPLIHANGLFLHAQLSSPTNAHQTRKNTLVQPPAAYPPPLLLEPRGFETTATDLHMCLRGADDMRPP